MWSFHALSYGVRVHHRPGTAVYLPVRKLHWASVEQSFYWSFGHVVELNLQSLSPPRRWGWYHVSQSPNCLITWLVFLEWLAPILNPYISGIWYVISSVCGWIQFACILFKIFVSTHKGYSSTVFLWCLCLFLVSGWYWDHRMNWEVFRPFLFWRSLRIGVNSSINFS